MTGTARGERGMALAMALWVLVLVGVLAATVSFLGVQEARMGESMRRVPRAFGVAEEGAAAVIRTWDPTIYNRSAALPLDSVAVPDGYPGAWTVAALKTGAYGGHVYKLNGELYLITIVGRDSSSPMPEPGGGGGRGGEVRQHVGVVAHVRPVASGVKAALTAGKGVRLSGPVRVDGADHVPTGWGPCGPPDSQQAGVQAPGGAATLEGITNSQLAAWATHTVAGRTFGSDIGPVVVAGRCDETVVTNWGDGRGPNYPCGNHFPVVSVTGDATVNGIAGQGILLVDGSLVVRGGLEWYGVALIRGGLTVIADPLRATAFMGAVLVEDSVVLQGVTGGLLEVTYSKCAISKALETVASAEMLRTRGWVGLPDVP